MNTDYKFFVPPVLFFFFSRPVNGNKLLVLEKHAYVEQYTSFNGTHSDGTDR